MTTAAAPTRPFRPAEDGARAPSARRSRVAALTARPELLALLALAAVLNLWSLGTNGMANEYYSAAVRAMSESWHAFLYGSFDAAGIMTVDKPPLALWIQALSVRVFGFSAWSMLVPQALMGIAAVGLLYDLVRRRFGRAAAFTAGLVLALTPITVAIWRHNNPDALLALCSVAALWAVVRGLEDGRTRWLVLAGVCVGLGFEAKMAAALLVVPGARRGVAVDRAPRAPRRGAPAVRRRRRAGRRRARLAGAGLAHPGRRPPVDLRHDRQQHLVADPRLQRPRPAVRPGGRARRRRPAASGGGGGGGAVRRRAGRAAAAQRGLGGQAGWLLGFALVAGIALRRRRRACAGRTRAPAGCSPSAARSLTIAVAFSNAEGIFHPYYMSELAPVHGRARRRRGRRGAARRTLARIVGAAGHRRRRGHRADGARDNPGQLDWLPPPCSSAVLARRRGARRSRSARAARRSPWPPRWRLLIAPGDLGGPDARPRDERHVPRGRSRDRRGFGGGRRLGGAGGAGGAGTAPPARRGGFGGGGGGGGFGGDTSVAHRGPGLREGARRRHDRRLEPVRARRADDRGRRTSPASAASPAARARSSLAWLADAVEQGRIRWVLTDGQGGGLPQDGRVGASQVLAVAAEVGDARRLRQRPRRPAGHGGRAAGGGRLRLTSARGRGRRRDRTRRRPPGRVYRTPVGVMLPLPTRA